MKTNFLLLPILFAFTGCLEVSQSGPSTIQSLLDSTDAPPVKYDPDFEFDYPLATVPGGIFKMGNTNNKKGYDPDECAYFDTVNTFKMGIYEVTKYQWMQVTGGNPGAFPDCLDCPAHHVSWYDAQQFIQKLNAITRRRYRLPTEAEWEYAARGGADGSKQNFLYAGGNDLKKIAWYNENSDNKLHPVGEKSPNSLGIYDLSGNVREWCEDIYQSYPNCPTEASLGVKRNCRGGSWSSSYYACRVSERMGVEPTSRYLNMGLRLAHD
ncbi:MAG: formylglycine-generating enzyme family protein [Saprospiraceae bacterium]|nr:formylglycine-generating enzyme family protein [Saprospiraceae bacterium]